ncbi:M24 family metallopeptidase [[Mycobacterium] holstebronense]|uniref:M24 family metallopeptidase n=1 Tax=[Mycobacterium] holstebronense TaxID=3064288 RepID=A0ABM9M2B9_9MYCO|nr:M24 family metallopeptidase [Mycolicibacter sp. MU0102]CAJ1508981.1 M24 family metallopeptidase [Mycolicibacter sp. MU0102]
MAAAAATLSVAAGGVEIAEAPDRARLRRETGGRLRAAMAERGIDALVLLGNDAVTYATGTSWRPGDAGLSHIDRPIAVVLADDPLPHLFAPERNAWESDLAADHLHPPAFLECDEGVDQFARVIAELIPGTAVVGVDECTGAMRRAQQRLFAARRPVDAAQVVNAAKLTKTADELSYIRTACQITGRVMAEVRARLSPGVGQRDLSAHFLRRAFECGADAIMLEPIWQVRPGELSTTGSGRELSVGDVVWSDASISYGGYCSAFGHTWLVGADPTPRQQAQFRQWHAVLAAVLDVTRAGATAGELARVATAANGGRRPWLPHGHLGHGLGVTAGEAPMIGTDLGAEFDENFVFEPGMVLVLEPRVWQDGSGGYRRKHVVVVTEDGFLSLTDDPEAPYAY